MDVDIALQLQSIFIFQSFSYYNLGELKTFLLSIDVFVYCHPKYHQRHCHHNHYHYHCKVISANFSFPCIVWVGFDLYLYWIGSFPSFSMAICDALINFCNFPCFL